MVVNKKTCIGCGTCVAVCSEGAIFFENGVAKIDPKKCKRCGLCASVCPVQAITEE